MDNNKTERWLFNPAFRGLPSFIAWLGAARAELGIVGGWSSIVRLVQHCQAGPALSGWLAPDQMVDSIPGGICMDHRNPGYGKMKTKVEAWYYTGKEEK